MKSFWRILALILLLLMTILLALPVQAAADPSQYPDYTKTGMSFSAADQYRQSFPMDATPNTISAWINLPASLADDTPAGVIFGNYDSYPAISLEIAKSGHPKLLWQQDEKNATEILFDKIDLRIGKWVHLSVTRNPAAGVFTCYINGEQKQQITLTGTPDIIPAGACRVGGDYRPGNTNYFKGEIAGIAVYPTARTASEITSKDMKIPDVKAALCIYMLNNKTDGLQDRSMKRNHLAAQTMFYDYTPKTGKYTIAVIPDTQYIIQSYPTLMPKVADFVLARSETDDIKFIIHVGDVVNNITDKEWSLAKSELDRFDGKIPYSLAPGNHDYVTSGNVRNTQMFNQYFPIDHFKANGAYGGAYDETSSDNLYFCFEAIGLKYMVMSLEFGPREDVVRWANEVIAAHPEHNVIVATHAYLNKNAQHIKPGDQYVPSSYSFLGGDCNNGDQLWSKLISKHPNIVLVLSGHINTENIVWRENKGEAGNSVIELLCDVQDLDNLYGGFGGVMFMTFSDGGQTVDISFASAIKNKYFKESNQFQIKLNVIGTPDPETTPEPESEPEPPAETTAEPGIKKPDGKQSCKSSAGFGVFAIIGFAAIVVTKTKGKKA